MEKNKSDNLKKAGSTNFIVKKQTTVTNKISNQIKTSQTLKPTIKMDKQTDDNKISENQVTGGSKWTENENQEKLNLKPNKNISIPSNKNTSIKVKPKGKSKNVKRKELEFKLKPEMSNLEKVGEIEKHRKGIDDLCNELSPKTVDNIKFIILKYWKNIVKALLSINIKMGLNGFKVLGDLLLEFDMYESAKSTFFFYVSKALTFPFIKPYS